MITIKLSFLRITLVVGVILVVIFNIYSWGDMPVLSIVGIIILMGIGLLMQKNVRKTSSLTVISIFLEHNSKGVIIL